MYVSFVEHPARMECGTSLAIREFAPSYRRATVMQVLLSVTGSLAAAAVWLMGASFWWLVGGAILFSIIPFTLLVIFPTNKKLLVLSPHENSDLTSMLFTRWARLHAVRSLLSFLSFSIFIFHLVVKRS